MQIQLWEGAVLRRAETVLQGTTQDTVRVEIDYGEKVSQRLWWKKLEEGIDWATRHSGTGHPEGCRVFGSERVVSCRNHNCGHPSLTRFDNSPLGDAAPAAAEPWVIRASALA
jgi:hypothetical protein